jgi:hypothetical protein
LDNDNDNDNARYRKLLGGLGGFHIACNTKLCAQTMLQYTVCESCTQDGDGIGMVGEGFVGRCPMLLSRVRYDESLLSSKQDLNEPGN